MAIGALTGCRTPSTAPSTVATRPVVPSTTPAVALPSTVLPTAYVEPSRLPPPTPPQLQTTERIPPLQSENLERYPIDLPTALRLAESSNYQVAYAREQINQAFAKVDSAQSMWLPSIRSGLGYNKHEGQIQDIVGEVFPKSRGNIWSGLGAGVPGAGSPAYPGIYANFHLADAIFEPLAARQAAAVKQHTAATVTNDIAHRTALAYLELLRAAEETAIVEATLNELREMVRLTAAYAETGQGSPAEHDRARTELSLRQNDLLRSQEAYRVASTRLAQVVRLNVDVMLEPLEATVVPLDLVSTQTPVGELVSQGLAFRPELGESRHLVSQAVQKMRREQYAVLMPSIVLGASYGGFGGGQGQTISNYGDRMDADAIAYWQLRNLGMGERAARAEAASSMRQANLQHMAMLDQVAREVIEAHAQVESRRQQINNAQQGIASATLSYQRNLDRIKQGQGLPIELLQANQALAQSRREYLRALIDYNIAQFSLYRAIGAPGNASDSIESQGSGA